MRQPADASCKCTCSDCSCSRFDCTCSKECYGQTQCLVNSDPNGKGKLGGGFGHDCASVSCTPEDDLSKELTCSVSGCTFKPNVAQLDPEASPTDVNANRQAKTAGLLFTVDVSGSMQKTQMASACAMDAFYKAAGSSSWSVGVTSMDVSPFYDMAFGRPTTGNLTGTSPWLSGLANACGIPACVCGGSFTSAGCQFNKTGGMVDSATPGGADLLKKLIVQESNEASRTTGGIEGNQTCEAGLEKAFLVVMENVKRGKAEEISQVVAITDTEADSDATLCRVQKVRYSSPNLEQLRAALGADFSPPANVGKYVNIAKGSQDLADCQTDLTNFYVYFFKRYRIRVNALIDTVGSTSGERVGKIYQAVAAATGGTIGDVNQCANFVPFFSSLGSGTSAISKEICLAKPADPATLQVTYTEAGANTSVPQSAQDGWTYDGARGCLQFHGSWENKLGAYSIRFTDPSTPGSRVCFPSGTNPVPSTLKVTWSGQTVPASATDGWTYDATSRCLQMHGSWAGKPGPYSVEYL